MRTLVLFNGWYRARKGRAYHTHKGATMASTTTTPLHPNPRIAKALAANDAHKYPSAAAWLRAHGINDKATQRTARQVLRDAGMGVGRGRTYSGQPGKLALRAAKANAKAASKAKQPAKATRKPRKATAKAQPQPQPTQPAPSA